MRPAWILAIALAGCRGPEAEAGVGTSGAETTASSSTGGPTLPPGCPGVDVGARAEFWVEGRESTEGDVACTAIGVRLAMDDLDVEVDLECDDAIDPGDTGPTVSRWTIKIGPAVERPAIAVGDAVVFRYELADLVACDEQSQFVARRRLSPTTARPIASRSGRCSGPSRSATTAGAMPRCTPRSSCARPEPRTPDTSARSVC